MPDPRLELRMRSRVFVFDDPQRRCYNGAYGAHHYEWGPWEVLDSSVKPEKREETLKYWRELNDYAVSQRGDSARKEFVIEEIHETEQRPVDA